MRLDVMDKRVKYSTLRGILRELGFTEHPIKGAHRAFRHEASDSIILLPSKRERWLGPSHLAVVARTLDERGLMDRDDFEERILNGHSSAAK